MKKLLLLTAFSFLQLQTVAGAKAAEAYNMNTKILDLVGKPVPAVMPATDDPTCSKCESLLLGDAIITALTASLPGDLPPNPPPNSGQPPQEMTPAQRAQQLARPALAERIRASMEANTQFSFSSDKERLAVVKRIFGTWRGIVLLRTVKVLAPDEPDLKITVE